MSVRVRSEKRKQVSCQGRNRAFLCAAQGTSSGAKEQEVGQSKDNNERTRLRAPRNALGTSQWDRISYGKSQIQVAVTTIPSSLTS